MKKILDTLYVLFTVVLISTSMVAISNEAREYVDIEITRTKMIAKHIWQTN